MMNAYWINDYEVWSGATLEDAIQAAMKFWKMPREEVAPDPCEQPASPDTRVIYTDEGPNAYSTIGQILAGMTEPGMVCGTED